MIKKYNNFINESLLDKLKGPSEEEVKLYKIGFTPGGYLINSAIFNNLDGVKKAIEIGASVHTDENLALIAAARYGYLDIVKYLIEHGAYIHAQKDLALRDAKWFYRDNVVEYLEEQIKKEKLTEGINNFLKGPSDEEIINNSILKGLVTKLPKNIEEFLDELFSDIKIIDKGLGSFYYNKNDIIIFEYLDFLEQLRFNFDLFKIIINIYNKFSGDFTKYLIENFNIKIKVLSYTDDFIKKT